jgi:hypothetical protein
VKECTLFLKDGCKRKYYFNKKKEYISNKKCKKIKSKIKRRRS